MEDMTEDGFLLSRPGSSLAGIGISLKDFNEALRPKGKLEDNKGNNFVYISINTLYPPLKNIKPEDLTYEIFMELINKTDYVFRKLVESLERKLRDERKGYKLEQVRIKDKIGK